jgi:hypothetical protein
VAPALRGRVRPCGARPHAPGPMPCGRAHPAAGRRYQRRQRRAPSGCGSPRGRRGRGGHRAPRHADTRLAGNPDPLLRAQAGGRGAVGGNPGDHGSPDRIRPRSSTGPRRGCNRRGRTPASLPIASGRDLGLCGRGPTAMAWRRPTGGCPGPRRARRRVSDGDTPSPSPDPSGSAAAGPSASGAGSVWRGGRPAGPGLRGVAARRRIRRRVPLGAPGRPQRPASPERAPRARLDAAAIHRRRRAPPSAAGGLAGRGRDPGHTGFSW